MKKFPYVVTVKFVVSAKNNTDAAYIAHDLVKKPIIVETVKSPDQLNELDKLRFKEDIIRNE